MQRHVGVRDWHWEIFLNLLLSQSLLLNIEPTLWAMMACINSVSSTCLHIFSARITDICFRFFTGFMSWWSVFMSSCLCDKYFIHLHLPSCSANNVFCFFSHFPTFLFFLPYLYPLLPFTLAVLFLTFFSSFVPGGYRLDPWDLFLTHVTAIKMQLFSKRLFWL